MLGVLQAGIGRQIKPGAMAGLIIYFRYFDGDLVLAEKGQNLQQ